MLDGGCLAKCLANKYARRLLEVKRKQYGKLNKTFLKINQEKMAANRNKKQETYYKQTENGKSESAEEKRLNLRHPKGGGRGRWRLSPQEKKI